MRDIGRAVRGGRAWQRLGKLAVRQQTLSAAYSRTPTPQIYTVFGHTPQTLGNDQNCINQTQYDQNGINPFQCRGNDQKCHMHEQKLYKYAQTSINMTKTV